MKLLTKICDMQKRGITCTYFFNLCSQVSVAHLQTGASVSAKVKIFPLEFLK